ncbi:hypothetical protein ACOZ38_20320 [Sphaerisporangium viridialbum]|uniref:hypothetical protein n=1 Tax=Sphaerisporangium viridialbum TaxID=46189 RepID=UPI003C71E390
MHAHDGDELDAGGVDRPHEGEDVLAQAPGVGDVDSGLLGGKHLWIAALGMFLLGSVLCASAWSATSLIVFRVVQGIAAAS